MFYYDRICAEGLLTINDLLKDDRSFYTGVQLKDRFPTIHPWIAYQCIIDAVPKIWKSKLAKLEDNSMQYVCKYDKLKTHQLCLQRTNK